MSDAGDEPEDAGAAERQLLAHLAVLREDAPRPSRELVLRVVRAARWQRALRGPLVAVGTLAAALTTGVAALLGIRRGDAER